MMRRAVFLDRDGVLVKATIRDGKPYPPSNIDEFEILPGVLESCVALRKAGFLLVVVTNQPMVRRGMQNRELIEEMNQMLRSLIPLEDIRVCYHDDEDHCLCRKPAPGMLLEAAQTWQIDLSTSYMIGDRWRDIEAGRKAGSKTILIDYSYEEQIQNLPDHRTHSLSEATEWILNSVKQT